MPGAAEPLGAAYLPGTAGPGRHRRLHRLLSGNRDPTRSPRLRHRRRSLQGRPPGRSRGPGLRRPRAALGHRLQISRPGRTHHRRGGGIQRRPHRRRDPGGPVETRLRGRRHRLQRHPAQPGRSPAQGRSGRGHRLHPPGRRRHPRSSAGPARAPARGHQAGHAPIDLPGVWFPGRKAPGRGRRPLHRQPLLSGPAQRGDSALRLPAGHGHRGARGRTHRTTGGPGDTRRPRRHLPPGRPDRAAGGPRTDGRKIRGQPTHGHRGEQSDDPGPVHFRPGHPGSGRDHRPALRGVPVSRPGPREGLLICPGPRPGLRENLIGIETINGASAPRPGATTGGRRRRPQDRAGHPQILRRSARVLPRRCVVRVAGGAEDPRRQRQGSQGPGRSLRDFPGAEPGAGGGPGESEGESGARRRGCGGRADRRLLRRAAQLGRDRAAVAQYRSSSGNPHGFRRGAQPVAPGRQDNRHHRRPEPTPGPDQGGPAGPRRQGDRQHLQADRLPDRRRGPRLQADQGHGTRYYPGGRGRTRPPAG